MGCLKLEDDYYKGYFFIMSDKKDKKAKKQKKRKELFFEILSVLTALSVIAIIVGYFMSLRNEINLLKVQSETVTSMNDYIYKDDNSINNQIHDINDNLDDLEDDLELIMAALNIKVVSVTDDKAVSAIDDAVAQDQPETSTTPAIPSAIVLGTDVNGTTYYVEDLVNELVLFTYQEDKKEIYFLGQYNENYHWDGYCVTNAYYSDGTLYGICESNFRDGKRIDYKSFYEDSKNCWTLSDRKCTDDGNIGTSINYSMEYEKIKNFTPTNVRRPDILYVDKLVAALKPTITKFYYGKTSKEQYNDTSGEAYLVKYDSDGMVKTLYVGNFVNGYCEDKTGNAWNIAYSDELKNYYHNTGNFSKNKAEKKSTEAITLEEINQIIQGYEFDCELTWKIE